LKERRIDGKMSFSKGANGRIKGDVNEANSKQCVEWCRGSAHGLRMDGEESAVTVAA
jgi:hypothetical protein